MPKSIPALSSSEFAADEVPVIVANPAAVSDPDVAPESCPEAAAVFDPGAVTVSDPAAAARESACTAGADEVSVAAMDEAAVPADESFAGFSDEVLPVQETAVIIMAAVNASPVTDNLIQQYLQYG
jgi:hypothetical protein